MYISKDIFNIYRENCCYSPRVQDILETGSCRSERARSTWRWTPARQYNRLSYPNTTSLTPSDTNSAQVRREPASHFKTGLTCCTMPMRLLVFYILDF